MAEKLRVNFSAAYYEDRIEEYLPAGRDRVMLPGPCWRTSMTIHGGASGGPVFDERGRVFAINSTGFGYVSSIVPVFEVAFKAQLEPDKDLVLTSVGQLIQRGIISLTIEGRTHGHTVIIATDYCTSYTAAIHNRPEVTYSRGIRQLQHHQACRRGRGGRRYLPYAFTRTRRNPGRLRAQQSPHRRDEPLRRARLRAATRATRLEQGSRPSARSARSAHSRRSLPHTTMLSPPCSRPSDNSRTAGTEAPRHRLHRRSR
jgi:hypothetical protein